MEYKFGDIALNSTLKKKPEDNDRFHYIGLEHLDSGSLFVQRYGADTAPVGEKLIIKKGDVLFGKRRAYQKKVAIAPFDGIFSAHGMVLRPNETIINKNYFPFFIRSDRFLNEAIRISVGSLSPTINWRDLKELRFELPPIEEQERLATLLWAAYDLKESYKNLITATDEMVKSQFIEMFGTPLSATQKWPIVPLKKCCEINPPRPKSNLLDSAMVSFIPMQAISEEGYIIKNEHKEYREVKKGFTYFQNDDVLFAKITPCMENGKGAIAYNLCNGVGMGSTEFHVLRPIGGLSNSHWLLHLTRLPLFRQEAERHMTGTAGQRRVPANFLSEFSIGIPPIKLQNDFKDIVIQADKSKAELQQSIDNIDKVMKSLLP